jgi:hypothetical protein
METDMATSSLSSVLRPAATGGGGVGVPSGTGPYSSATDAPREKPRGIISTVFWKLVQHTLFFRLIRTLLRDSGADQQVPSAVQALQSQIRNLRGEVRTLEDLQVQLVTEVNELYRAKEISERVVTCKARMANAFGQAFSVFWVLKLTLASFNVVFKKSPETDPITRIIRFLLQNGFNVSVNLQVLSQQVTFVFVGIVIAAQIRGFVLHITTAFDKLRGRNSVAVSGFLIPLVTEVMGMYFMSSVLLMRMNLPLEYRTILTRALGDIDFQFYHRWFDFIFVSSAAVSLLILVATSESAKHLYDSYVNSCRRTLTSDVNHPTN